MADSANKTAPKQSTAQLMIILVIPILVLLFLSDESRLGPARSLMLALAFPIGFELFNLFKGKKVGYLSLLSIAGIITTGGIGLLGLSEQWLAIRRSIPYAVAALVIAGSILIKKPLLDALLPFVLDTQKVYKQATKRKSEHALKRSIRRAGVQLACLLALVAASSYILTLFFIKSATDTAAFNQEYARLRLLSLAATTLPLLIGVTLILFLLVSAIERHTGLEFEQILKKK